MESRTTTFKKNKKAKKIKVITGIASSAMAVGIGVSSFAGNPGKAAACDCVSYYTVQKNDTLSAIAARYHVSVKQEEMKNGLKSDRIYVSQKLIVPDEDSQGRLVSSGLPSDDTYVIKKGDTFTSISEKTGVPVNQLISDNPNLNPTNLQIGQHVTINSHKSSTSAVSQSSTHKPSNLPDDDIYIIQKDDTFTSISKKTGVPVNRLMSDNPNLSPNHLQIGQHMTINKTDSSALLKKTEKTHETNSSVPTVTYKVQKGDALSTIAKKFGVSLETLKDLNKEVLNYNIVQINDEVLIPAKNVQWTRAVVIGSVSPTKVRFDEHDVNMDLTVSDARAFNNVRGHQVIVHFVNGALVNWEEAHW